MDKTHRGSSSHETTNQIFFGEFSVEIILAPWMFNEYYEWHKVVPPQWCVLVYNPHYLAINYRYNPHKP